MQHSHTHRQTNRQTDVHWQIDKCIKNEIALTKGLIKKDFDCLKSLRACSHSPKI